MLATYPLLVGNLLLNRVEIKLGMFPVIDICFRRFYGYEIVHVNCNIFPKDNAYLAASNYPKVFMSGIIEFRSMVTFSHRKLYDRFILYSV